MVCPLILQVYDPMDADMLKYTFIMIVAYLLPVDGFSGETKSILGKSLCEIGLDKTAGYSIGLDRSTGRYMVVRKKGNSQLLMIVKYSNEADQCGTIRDVISSSSLHDQFEFECQSNEFPSAIIIGELKSQKNWDRLIAQRAWKIDLDADKLIPIFSKVICNNTSYSGTDIGEDLLTWSKKRSQAK